MPSFANPFQGNVDRKLTNAELMQALRLDIAGELEAIFLYDAHYLATDDPVAKAVLADIRDEEKVHRGRAFPGRRVRGQGAAGGAGDHRREHSRIRRRAHGRQPGGRIIGKEYESWTI